MSAIAETQPIATRFIPIAGAAQRASVSGTTILRWIRERRLHAYQPRPRGKLLIEIEELDRLILASATG